MRKTRLLLLMTAILLCNVAASAQSFEVDGIYYTITSPKNMTVAVTYTDFNSGVYYGDDICIPSTVTFDEQTYSVTSIGNHAFSDCSNLTSVTIPESVTEIGWDAFVGCSNLTSIDIPESVTKIGAYAFHSTSWYENQPDGVIYINNILYSFKGEMLENTSIEIVEGTVHICDAAFFFCSSLTSITIPEGVTEIGVEAFAGCSNLAFINIPKSVTKIGANAFHETPWYDNQVDGVIYINNILYSFKGEMLENTSIEIVEGTVHICGSAFYGCSNLTSITIPESVTEIGSDAFVGCSNLAFITIPESVTSIGVGAFYGCYFTRDNFVNNSSCSDDVNWGATIADEERDGLLITSNIVVRCKDYVTDAVIPDDIIGIGDDAFSSCSSLTSITIPESVTSIGRRAFYGCSNLTTITIPESVTEIGYMAFSNCSNLASITIPENVTEIGYGAFSGCYFTRDNFVNNSSCSDDVNWGATILDKECDGLLITNNVVVGCRNYVTTAIIPDDIIGIGNNAFFGCSDLTSITIPESVTSIGWSAFNGCSSLTAITIPDGVTEIGHGAFFGCSGELTVNCNIPSEMPGGGCFSGNNFSKITIGDNVTSIGDYAFSGSSNLISIIIPKSVTEIGDRAFSGSSNLTSIIIPESVTEIGEHAFEGCSGELTVNCNIPSTWSNYCFSGNNFSKITIGDNVTLIGNSAFSGCSNLTSITIPESVTEIGEGAFYRCSGELIVNCNIPSSDWYLNGWFGGNNFSKVTIGDNVTSIGDYAFCKSGNLTSITIPKSVTEIGENAFESCSILTSVHISSLENWCNMHFGNAYANPLANAGHLYLNGVLITELAIPDSITTIGDFAFYNCSSLTSLTLPSTMDTIGVKAFFNSCDELTCLATIPPYVKGDNVLEGGTTVYVPMSCVASYENTSPWMHKRVLSILNPITVHVEIAGTMGEEILKHVDYLSHVNDLTVTGVLGKNDIENLRISMPELINIDISETDMTEIPDGMFKECRKLCSIVLPKGLETIGNEAFHDCDILSEVVIHEGVKCIGKEAFASCSSLTNISLPNSLEVLGEECFRNCNLSEVVLPAELKVIPDYAFAESFSLQKVMLPEKLDSIGAYAFDFTGLQEIIFPKRLKYIGLRAFYDCKVSRITIPEGCTYIGLDAFGGCDNLTMATLPSTLVSYNGIFSYDLDSLICMALIPPALQSTELPSNSTLFVPALAVNNYKQTPGWASFREILPIEDAYPQSIYVIDEQTLNYSSENIPLEYNPNMYVGYNHSRREYFDDYKEYYDEYEFSIHGALHLKGDATWSLNRLNMSHFLVKHKGYYDEDENWIEGEEISSSLINETTVTADTIVTEVYAKPNEWAFLSFPYDVKVSDILTQGGDWVIRRYDGQARAEANYDQAWATVPYEGVLEAGKGYIWSGTDGYFGVVALDNENKNRIFAHDTLYTTLNGYSSERATDANWNLIGNPFPSYYDTRFMEYSAPVTVWDRENHTYAAYSPIDDSYVLTPFEAFFVQKPTEVETIAFAPEGRQVDKTARVVEASAKARVRGENRRQVLNLTLSNTQYTDRTRVVLNDKARKEYEAECDAPKFMSNRAQVPQLFTIEVDADMAINERPMGDGLVALGTYFGEYGSYTLAMESAATQQVLLVDHLTGVTTDLTYGSYTFTSDAGNYTDRFSLIIGEATNIAAIDEGDIKVDGAKNTITVSAAMDVNVEIFNAAGIKVAMDSGKTMAFNVTAGVYIVKVGETSYKVSVK